MGWGTLQVLQVAILAAIAVPTHVGVARLRRPFVERLEKLAGRAVRPFAAVSEVVAALLYLAFAAATVPFDGRGPVGPFRIESVLDTVALFALLVATIQLLSLVTLHRIARHLEPWPPKILEPPSP